MNDNRRPPRAYLFALTLVVAAAAAGSPAWAENWARMPGQHSDECVDLDSIRTEADGFTHFLAMECVAVGKGWYKPEPTAVRCAQNLAGQVTYFKYFGDKWHPDVYPSNSRGAAIVRFVCQRAR
jgi:hypothetical protein